MSGPTLKPLFSIITVCFNSENTIEQTIRSVIGQSFHDFEYLIIDGGSTDGTLKIIDRYRDQIQQVITEPDEGIYDAMNKGIKRCSGMIIGLLNSDDWYEPNTLETIANEYLQSDGETLLHGLCKFFENGKEGRIISYHHDVLPNFCILHCTCFVPKKLYDKFGLFNTSYKIAADYDFLLRLYLTGVNFKRLEKIVVNFSDGGASSSHNSTYEVIRIQFNHNLFGKGRYLIKIIRHSLFHFFHTVVIRPYQKLVVEKRSHIV